VNRAVATGVRRALRWRGAVDDLPIPQRPSRSCNAPALAWRGTRAAAAEIVRLPDLSDRTPRSRGRSLRSGDAPKSATSCWVTDSTGTANRMTSPSST